MKNNSSPLGSDNSLGSFLGRETISKLEIIANLKEFNDFHGIIFTSEEDAEEYYKALVELIEKLTNK